MTPPLKTVGGISILRLLSNVTFGKGSIFFFLNKFSLTAFNKLVNVNSQDFNLQLVDTAGQVSNYIDIISGTTTKLYDF